MRERDSSHEGPQVRLKLCKWFKKTHEELGGSDDSYEVLVKAVGDNWMIPRFEVVKILNSEDTWFKQCDERGVTAEGLKRDEAHLPR